MEFFFKFYDQIQGALQTKYFKKLQLALLSSWSDKTFRTENILKYIALNLNILHINMLVLFVIFYYDHSRCRWLAGTAGSVQILRTDILIETLRRES